MKAKMFTVQLPAEPQAVVFVNGIKSRNLRGLLYMWRNLNQLRLNPLRLDGCLDLKAGLVGPNEFVLVSYWQSASALHDYFKSDVHRSLMKHYYHHADDFELYNETYHPSHGGKYNAAHGMAKVYATTKQ